MGRRDGTVRRHASGPRRNRGADQRRQHPLPRPRRGLLRRQVGDRLRRDRPAPGRREAPQGARAPSPARFERALEIGAGTGYFSLNLMLDGTIAHATATDISPGMLAALRANADRLGLDVDAVAAERRGPPLRRRELRPGAGPRGPAPHPRSRPRRGGVHAASCAPAATVVFCGEPSCQRRPARGLAQARRRARRPRSGDAPSAPPSAATAAAPTPTTATPSRRRSTSTPSTPQRSRRTFEAAGFEDARVRGEELLANIYGWGLRTVESTAEPDRVPTAGATSPSTPTWPCSASTRPCSSRTCPRSSSTTSSSRRASRSRATRSSRR